MSNSCRRYLRSSCKDTVRASAFRVILPSPLTFSLLRTTYIIPGPTLYPGGATTVSSVSHTTSQTSTSTSSRSTSTSTSTSSSSSSSSSSSTSSSAIPTQTATSPRYGQCGGIGWSGPTVCASPYTCTKQNGELTRNFSFGIGADSVLSRLVFPVPLSAQRLFEPSLWTGELYSRAHTLTKCVLNPITTSFALSRPSKSSSPRTMVHALAIMYIKITEYKVSRHDDILASEILKAL